MLVVTVGCQLTEKYKNLLQEKIGEPLTFYDKLDLVHSYEKVEHLLSEQITGHESFALLSLLLIHGSLMACSASALTVLTGKRPLVIRFWAEWDEDEEEFMVYGGHAFDFL